MVCYLLVYATPDRTARNMAEPRPDPSNRLAVGLAGMALTVCSRPPPFVYPLCQGARSATTILVGQPPDPLILLTSKG